MKKLLISIWLAAGLAGGACARTAVPLPAPTRVEVNAGNAEQMKSAIVQGSARHSWQIQASEPGKITLAYSKQGGRHQLVVSVAYDAAGFQVQYVSSVGMDYKQTTAGEEIHPFYTKWVTTLSDDIVSSARIASSVKP